MTPTVRETERGERERDSDTRVVAKPRELAALRQPGATPLPWASQPAIYYCVTHNWPCCKLAHVADWAASLSRTSRIPLVARHRLASRLNVVTLWFAIVFTLVNWFCTGVRIPVEAAQFFIRQSRHVIFFNHVLIIIDLVIYYRYYLTYYYLTSTLLLFCCFTFVYCPPPLVPRCTSFNFLASLYWVF